ncbi:MAG: nucleotidyl transferase AbiEii/AbiGii toxin family protein [Bacteroidetes bacterium]|nr:nucleotidyl transferase AbiEii/AbiGii toxin family protein [Bacteroidota bacterium]
MNELSILPKQTRLVLTELSKIEFISEFTFVGGSALAIYLEHRISEDIDLFSYKDTIDMDGIIQSISENHQLQIVNKSEKQLDLIVDQVKTTFFANNWDGLKLNHQFLNHLSIAELEILTALKINTLFLRAKFRDYYDLYVINKEKFSLDSMFQMGIAHIPNLTIKLFQMSLTFIDDIEDENILQLQPKYKVTLKQMQEHFIKKIKEQNK